MERSVGRRRGLPRGSRTNSRPDDRAAARHRRGRVGHHLLSRRRHDPVRTATSRRALAAFEDPAVGMLTSRVFPRYEVEPSGGDREARAHAGDQPSSWRQGARLGCDRHGGRNHRGGDVDPAAGAGSAALDRRDAWLWLPDRTGTSLSSGGDIEFGAMVGAAGFRRLYVPELRLEHRIPAGARPDGGTSSGSSRASCAAT